MRRGSSEKEPRVLLLSEDRLCTANCVHIGVTLAPQFSWDFMARVITSG